MHKVEKIKEEWEWRIEIRDWVPLDPNIQSATGGQVFDFQYFNLYLNVEKNFT